MNGRYLETLIRYSEVSQMVENVEKELQTLVSQIKEYEELFSKFNGVDPRGLSDEELAEYEKNAQELKDKLSEIEKVKEEKAKKEEQYNQAIKDQQNIYQQMKEIEKQRDRLSQIGSNISNEEMEDLLKEQEKINEEIEKKEKRKEELEKEINELQQQKSELNEEYKKFPSDTSLEKITEKEISDKIAFAQKSNKIEKELKAKKEELAKIDPELSNLYKEQVKNEKLISKKEKEIKKEEKKEEKKNAKLQDQIKEFEELSASNQLLTGKKLVKYINTFNTIQSSNLSDEEKKEFRKKFNDRLSLNNALLDGKVVIKDSKVEPKEEPKVTTKHSVVAKGKKFTVENFKAKFANAKDKVMNFIISKVAKGKLAEMEAKLAEQMGINAKLSEENEKLNQENIDNLTRLYDEKDKNEKLNQENADLSRDKINLEQDKRNLQDEVEIQTKMSDILAGRVVEEQKSNEEKDQKIARQQEEYEKIKQQMEHMKELISQGATLSQDDQSQSMHM